METTYTNTGPFLSFSVGGADFALATGATATLPAGHPYVAALAARGVLVEAPAVPSAPAPEPAPAYAVAPLGPVIIKRKRGRNRI